MIKQIDYIFYRFYNLYGKLDKGYEISSAVVLLSLLEAVVILDFFILLELLSGFELPSQIAGLDFKFIMVPLIIVFYIINGIKYSKISFDELTQEFGNESLQKRNMKGLFLIICTILIIGLPIVLGILEHNLGIIR